MRIDVYLDDGAEPIESFTPPETFNLDTTQLADGPHEIRLVAVDSDGVTGERRMSFTVQNGPSIAVHGLRDADIVTGEISVLANAYGSKIGDAFQPTRIETPAPIPTWAWVLFLCVFAWGAGYVSLELHDREALPTIAGTIPAEPAQAAETSEGASWAELGEQVYGNMCASCHQVSGAGLAGVFPPLIDNPAVLDDDPTDHINAIVHGLSGKVIDGVAYPTPMPPFGAMLSDEEVAAVVNHERTQWGNDARIVSADDVAALRASPQNN